MDSDVSSTVSTVSTVSDVTPVEWAQVEEDLHRLCALQTDASRRMEALRVALSFADVGLIPLIPMIQESHEASLEELESTGEVTFGARLLMELRGKTKSE